MKKKFFLLGRLSGGTKILYCLFKIFFACVILDFVSLIYDFAQPQAKIMSYDVAQTQIMNYYVAQAKIMNYYVAQAKIINYYVAQAKIINYYVAQAKIIFWQESTKSTYVG